MKKSFFLYLFAMALFVSCGKGEQKTEAKDSTATTQAQTPPNTTSEPTTAQSVWEGKYEFEDTAAPKMFRLKIDKNDKIEFQYGAVQTNIMLTGDLNIANNGMVNLICRKIDPQSVGGVGGVQEDAIFGYISKEPQGISFVWNENPEGVLLKKVEKFNGE
jgi:hypothetical protein